MKKKRFLFIIITYNKIQDRNKEPKRQEAEKKEPRKKSFPITSPWDDLTW